MFTSITQPNADTVVYSFSPLLLALVFALSLAVGVAGWFLRQRGKLPSLGFGCMALGLLGLALIGPMMARDRVTLTRRSIYQNTGFWFAPTVKGFEFQGVDRIAIIAVRKRRGEPAQNHWYIQRGNLTQEIDPGDLWDNNANTIIPWLEQGGIKVVGRTK